MNILDSTFTARVACTSIPDFSLQDDHISFTLGKNEYLQSEPAKVEITVTDYRTETLTLAKMRNDSYVLRGIMQKPATVMLHEENPCKLEISLHPCDQSAKLGWLLSIFYFSAMAPVEKHLDNPLFIRESLAQVMGQPAYINCVVVTNKNYSMWWTIGDKHHYVIDNYFLRKVG